MALTYVPRHGISSDVGLHGIFGGALNLQLGSLAHRDIGSRVDRVRGLERMRQVVFLMVAALLAGLLFQLLAASGPIRP